MDHNLIQIFGIGMGIIMLVIGGSLFMVSAHRSAKRLKSAWANFASARSWQLVWARKPLWLASYDSSKYKIQGNADGVPVVIELTQRSLHWMAVSAPIRVAHDTPPGAEILKGELEKNLQMLLHNFCNIRRQVSLAIWPEIISGRPTRRGDGHRIIIGWQGREQDPKVLAMAVDLVVALAKQPPLHFGSGAKYVPYYLRKG